MVKLTFKSVKAELAFVKVGLTKRDGEYRVTINGRRGPDYFTNDLQDALDTGLRMAPASVTVALPDAVALPVALPAHAILALSAYARAVRDMQEAMALAPNTDAGRNDWFEMGDTVFQLRYRWSQLCQMYNVPPPPEADFG